MNGERETMKLKYFSIFIFLFLLICCANAVSAAADDNVFELDQSHDLVSSSVDEKLALGIGNPLSDSEDGGSGDEGNDGNDIDPNDGTGEGNGTDGDGTDAGESGNGTDSGEGNGTSESGNGTDSGEGNGTSESGNGTGETTTSTTPTTPAVPSDTAYVSTVSALNTALKEGKKTIYLTANLKITKSFSINRNVVIDGKGHYINAQNKTDIFRISGVTVTLRNIVLKNAKSTIGGAIYASGSTLNLKKCNFTGNKVSDKGGAIYLYNGKLNIDGCTFQSNKASLNGGAIYTSTSKLIIKNSKFISNKVENGKSNGHGGAIHAYKKTSSITGTTFKTNYCLSTALKSHSKATKYQFTGGAIYYNLGTSHNLTSCTFTSNKASNHGGAVYGYKPDYLKINKCTFNTNKVAYEDGGAITFNGKKLVIGNSKFYKNHAYEDGGVMDACSQNKNKVYITVSNCTFKENTAYKGGGVFWMGVRSVFTIKNSKFISNKAGMAGALFAESTVAKITGCLFQSNQAKKVASWTVKTKSGQVLKHCGGVLRLQGKNVQFVKCTFKKNHATYGGVVFQTGGKLKMTSVKYSGNTAKSGPKIKKG